MKAFIQLIADYGVGDPAFSEVIQRLKALDADLEIQPTSVPAFSTVATGYWIAQFARGKQPSNYIIYANTAPRKDAKQERKNNEGEKLTYAVLNNGTKIVAVNSGYSFSFIKNEIKQLNLVTVANAGSQFRSRDYYPQAVVGFLHGELETYVGKNLKPKDIIPDIPENLLAFADGYGNLKTTIKRNQINFEAGTRVKITLNQVKRLATFATGNFEVKDGELAFAPGSTGEKGNEFLEIFLRGGSAWQAFNNPVMESSIEFEAVV